MGRNQILIINDEKIIASIFADAVVDEGDAIFIGNDMMNGYRVRKDWPDNSILEWWIDEGHSIKFNLQNGKWVRK